MGIDFDALWGQAKQAASGAVDDLVKTGAPALQASLEQWGIDTLNAMHKETTATLDKNVKEIASRPDAPPGSFAAALNGTLQNTVFSVYGGYITVGVIALIALGIFLAKKGK